MHPAVKNDNFGALMLRGNFQQGESHLMTEKEVGVATEYLKDRGESDTMIKEVRREDSPPKKKKVQNPKGRELRLNYERRKGCIQRGEDKSKKKLRIGELAKKTAGAVTHNSLLGRLVTRTKKKQSSKG